MNVVNAHDRHQPRSKKVPKVADWNRATSVGLPKSPRVGRDKVKQISTVWEPAGPEILPRTRSILTVKLWSKVRLPDGQPVGCR